MTAITQLNPEQRLAIRRWRVRRATTYLIAILLAFWILLPIWLIMTMAFSSAQDVRAYPLYFAPIPFSTETMQFFIDADGILQSTLNSLWVAVLTMVFSTLIATPAGYAISRFVFRGRDAIRLGILAVRAFPIVILAVPLAVIFINLGLYDSLFSLSLLHTALVMPSSVLVISSVFATVPYELEEAAKVFGCTPFQAFLKVIVPLVLPGVAASAIFAFVTSWNEVFAAILLTLQNRTLPAQILFSLDKSGDPFKFAGAFFMLVPSMIFMFFIRRYLFNMWGQITK
ncbi:MAG: carbohydrate ABC transporter permease [Anaerolineae bacterium]